MSSYQNLPSMNELLNSSKVKGLTAQRGDEFIKECCKQALNELRISIKKNPEMIVNDAETIKLVEQKVTRAELKSLKRVINATGVILHTNLGRSVLSPEIKENFDAVAFGYSNLEYDLESGSRGIRYEHVESLLTELTGAEAAVVVNNNAAAVMLLLDSFAKGRNVLVSRGELVEIGGSFRIPDIITSVGGKLKEIGTTNKTHSADYENAIDDETAAILKVHTSNYKIIGFTEAVSESSLHEIAKSHQIPLITDLGSGLLVNLGNKEFAEEPTVMDAVKNSDLVAFSGDKLLGGPQAGIIVGRKALIDQLKRNQLLRALRVDKLTLVALSETLKIYDRGEARQKIPTIEKIVRPLSSSKSMAEKLAQVLNKIEDVEAETKPGTAKIGGGSFPGVLLPTVTVEMWSTRLSEVQLELSLRQSAIPVIVRVHDNKVVFDVLTLNEDDLTVIVKEVSAIIEQLEE